MRISDWSSDVCSSDLSRTSTFAFRGKELSADQIASQLGVSYVVEGSVRRQGNRVHVNAALIDGASGSSRWSNSYEAASGDVYAIEQDIGRKVMTEIGRASCRERVCPAV